MCASCLQRNNVGNTTQHVSEARLRMLEEGTHAAEDLPNDLLQWFIDSEGGQNKSPQDLCMVSIQS